MVLDILLIVDAISQSHELTELPLDLKKLTVLVLVWIRHSF